MRIKNIFLSLLVVVLLGTSSVSSASAQDTLQEEIDFATEQVYPALVNISVVVKDFARGRTERRMGAGSGVLVSPEGHVLTNYHVAAGGIRIFCTLTTGERVRADVIGADAVTDLAVLKLRAGDRENPNEPIPYAKIGDSDALEVGESVLAMGNPMSLSSSTTVGVVSNPARVFTDFMGTEIQNRELDGQQMGIYTSWIQHDALILPGNSGGPLVNLSGEIVGINQLGGQGMGFAIPSNLASGVLNQILTNDGEIIRGWAGLDVLPTARVGVDDGVFVSSVFPQSPAEKAGIQPGDVLLKIGERDVGVANFEDVPAFNQIVAGYQPGESTTVTLRRSGEVQERDITFERRKSFAGEEMEVRSIGATVSEITEPMAIEEEFSGTDGVLVTGVRSGGMAENAEPSLESGDRIVRIGDHEVQGTEDFRNFLSEKEEFDALQVAFIREDENQLTVLEPDEDPGVQGGALGQPWLGVETQVLTPPLARSLGHEDTRGFRVTRVYRGTEAEEAGLRKGDIITAFQGENLDAHRTQDAQELQRRIEDRMIGDEVELTIIRDGEEQTVSVTLEETPSTAEDSETFFSEVFEFGVREITHMDRLENNWDDSFRGLVVTTVESGSWTSLAGLRQNDVIKRVQGQRIESISDLESALEQVHEQEPERIQIFIQRGTGTHFVFVRPDWEEIQE